MTRLGAAAWVALIVVPILFTIVVLVGLVLTGCLWRENGWLNRRRAQRLAERPRP